MLAQYRAQAARFRKELKVVDYRQFRVTFALQGSGDEGRVREIYRSCKLANLWGCHSVHEGHIHRCPQSIYIPRLLPGSAPPGMVDGLPLRDTPSFRQELHDYLTSPEPLWSCRYCLGTSGAEREHVLVPHKGWRDHHERAGDGLLRPPVDPA